jgi:hypothetical protein
VGKICLAGLAPIGSYDNGPEGPGVKSERRRRRLAYKAVYSEIVDGQFELRGLWANKPPRPGGNNAPGRRGGVSRSSSCVGLKQIPAPRRRAGATRRARAELGGGGG